MSKQDLINGVINTALENEPSLVSTIRGYLEDEALFASKAAHYAIFVGAHVELILGILAYIHREEPRSFQMALQESVRGASAYNKIDILTEIVSTYPQADLHFEEESPLRVASQNGAIEIVRFLMNRGANPRIGHYNAIAIAADVNRPEILALLNRGE